MEILAVLVVAASAFAAAVWFGLRIVAPRLGRAVDRMDADDSDEDAG